MHEHDRSYRLLFAQPRMVEDLVREFVPEAWVERLDFRPSNGSMPRMSPGE